MLTDVSTLTTTNTMNTTTEYTVYDRIEQLRKYAGQKGTNLLSKRAEKAEKMLTSGIDWLFSGELEEIGSGDAIYVCSRETRIRVLEALRSLDETPSNQKTLNDRGEILVSSFYFGEVAFHFHTDYIEVKGEVTSLWD